jgi:hypothetical protein
VYYRATFMGKKTASPVRVWSLPALCCVAGGTLFAACADAPGQADPPFASQASAVKPGDGGNNGNGGGSGANALHGTVWVDSSGAVIPVVAALLPSWIPNGFPSGGGSSSGSSTPPPFATLLVADANGFVWQTTTAGQPAAVLGTLPVYYASPDCGASGDPAYVDTSFPGFPGPRFVVATTAGAFTLPDTPVTPSLVTTLSSPDGVGGCSGTGGRGIQGIALTSLVPVGAPSGPLFTPPAHPEFLP